MWHSVELYVLLLTVAALLVGLIVRPSERGEAQTFFAKGELGHDDNSTPRVEVRCLDNGDVELRRCGLSELTDGATVALAITKIGFTLSIEERITPGDGSGELVDCATFVIKELGRERYHLKYNSDSYSVFVAFALPNRAGIEFSRNFPSV